MNQFQLIFIRKLVIELYHIIMLRIFQPTNNLHPPPLPQPLPPIKQKNELVPFKRLS